MRYASRVKAMVPWWTVSLAVGAGVMYLLGAAFQLLTGRALETIVWPPFVLLLVVLGAILGLLSEGIRRLAGGVGWAMGIGLCLFPTMILGLALLQTSRTPGMEFRWREFLPVALVVELFVIAYWAARTRLVRPEDGA